MVAAIPFSRRLVFRSRSRLAVMRAVLISSVVRITALGLLVALVAVSDEGSALAWALVAIGAVIALFVSWARLLWPREVPEGTDPASLFWLTHLVSEAIAMAPALIGFVGVFLGGGPKVFVAGAVASLVALAGILPTQRYVDRFQGRLDDLGYSIDLHAVIRTTS